MSVVTLGGGSTPAGPLRPLTIDGQFFRSAGQRTTLIETSDFSAFRRALDHDVLDTQLDADRHALNFNTRRVWLLNQSVVGYRNEGTVDAGIAPWLFPNFYAELRAYAIRQARLQFILDVTAFTQTQTLMPRREDQQLHLDATADALRDLPHILSLVNEDDQHDNAVAPGLIRPTAHVIFSAGSNGADAIPPSLNPATTDAVEYHANDLDQWWRKTGHNTYEWASLTGVPGWCSESTRTPDRDSNPAHYFDAAAGGALLCAGTCGHSIEGKFSRLFVGQTRVCLAAHVAGAQSVPLEFQPGQYLHRTDLEAPGILRAYERRLADGRGHVVLIRA